MLSRLLELVSKRKNNCDIIKSYNQSYDRFNLIKIISYFLKIDFLLVIYHLTYLTFLVNLLNQIFKSTYIINLLDQLTIELTVLLAYGILFPQIYI